MKSYQNYKKDLKVKHIMYLVKKLTKFPKAVMTRLQCFDRTVWYLYGISVVKVCKIELLNTMLNIK